MKAQIPCLKDMKKTIAFSILFLLLVSYSFAGDIPDKAGSSGLSFLKIGMGARPVGMGEAFTAVSADVNCVYWNPAGLARIDGFNLTFMHNQWFQQISSNYLATAFGIKQNSVGISLTLNRVPEIQIRDKPTSEPISAFDAEDVALVLAYARSLNSKIDFGVSIKGLYEKIFVDEAFGLGFDVGAIYFLNNRLQVGCAILNVGPEMKLKEEKFSLPSVSKIGMIYETNESYLNGNIILGLDLVKLKDNDLKMHWGAEYAYRKSLFLRMGYQFGYDEKNISFGFGLKHKRYKIDYAFVPFGSDLGDTHRISLEVKM